tara:strand:+ start:4037 stop:4426 length:390 start_codon:yes stop_codon:yes gene_type:complete
MNEIEKEANYNFAIKSLNLTRSLSVPIPDTWHEKETWCSAKLVLHLRVDESVARIWTRIIENITPIGYIRSGSYRYDKHQDHRCIITSYIELYEHVDLYELKTKIRKDLGVVCHLFMENFSFPKELISK